MKERDDMEELRIGIEKPELEDKPKEEETKPGNVIIISPDDTPDNVIPI